MNGTAEKIVIFDCDSTLSSIEGIDELARPCAPEVHQRITEMTLDAMEGRIRLEEVFGKRLEWIKPSRQAVEALGELYIETMLPGAEACVADLQNAGWTCIILSGGILQAILPIAARLKIDQVEAVSLRFDADGNYLDFDLNCPTTRTGGKPLFIESLRKTSAHRDFIVMVGDGASDLETKTVVDLFVGFGGVIVREKVRAESHHFIMDLSELAPLLAKICEGPRI